MSILTYLCTLRNTFIGNFIKERNKHPLTYLPQQRYVLFERPLLEFIGNFFLKSVVIYPSIRAAFVVVVFVVVELFVDTDVQQTTRYYADTEHAIWNNF